MSKQIGNSQHGITKGKSHLKKFGGISRWGYSTGRTTDIVYLDFCKAVDTIPRDILVSNLERLGF